MIPIEGQLRYRYYNYWSLVKSVTIVFLCILLQAQKTSGQGQVGDSCFLPNGDRGTCLEIAQCVVTFTASNEPLQLCSRQGKRRIVCCEIDDFDDEVTPSVTRTTTKRRPTDSPILFVEDEEYTIRPNNRPWETTARSTSARRTTLRTTREPAVRPALQRSKAEEMCDAYHKQLNTEVVALALTPIGQRVSTSRQGCKVKPLTLVVGGTKAEKGEFPHMAALGYRNIKGAIEYNCGGTLISELFVVTAAHCCDKPSNLPVLVRLGAWNISVNDEVTRPVNYNVTDIIRHPRKRPRDHYNDIALLRLSGRVEFTQYIKPACLNTDNSILVKKAWASGWGKLAQDGPDSKVLQKVLIDVIDNGKCNELYTSISRSPGSGIARGIDSTMLCAGDLGGGKDTCQGDSGGPLQVRGRDKCLHSLVGITSFGVGCAARNTPGIYSRVSSFVPWIESVVWP